MCILLIVKISALAGVERGAEDESGMPLPHPLSSIFLYHA